MGGTTLVLSGGGSRGSFQLGALRYLYRQRAIKPDLIVGSSVGAIHAAKLAEAPPGDRNAQLRVIDELTSVWTTRMQRNENMYTWAPWTTQAFSDSTRQQLKDLMEAGGFDRLFANLQTDAISTLAAAAVGGPVGGLAVGTLRLFEDVQFLSEVISAFRRGLGGSLFTLTPLRLLMEGGLLNADKVRGGTELRLAVVSLDDAAVRWTDGAGRLRAGDDTLIQGVPRNPLIECVLASAAMPIAFEPVTLSDGHTYTDGGVREIVPTALVRNREPDEVYTVICSPRVRPDGVSGNAAAGGWSIGEVAARMLDILLDEVVAGDLAAVGQHPAHHVIVPDLPVHDTTVIDPGLIDINVVYGFLSADDVLADTTPENRLELRHLTNAVTQLRIASRAMELPFAIQPGTNPERTHRDIQVVRWLVRGLLERRVQLGGVAPEPAWYRTPIRPPAGEPSLTTTYPDLLAGRDGWHPNIFLREDDGRMWAVIGGAPFQLASTADYDAARITVPDPNPVPLPACRAPQYLRRVPAPGYFLQERGAAPVYYSDGAKLWHVPSPAVLEAMGVSAAGRKVVHQVPPGAISGLPMARVPVNFMGPFTLSSQLLNTPTPDARVADAPIGESRDGLVSLRTHRPVTVTNVRVEDPKGVFSLAGTYAGKQLSVGELLNVTVSYAPKRHVSVEGKDQSAILVVESTDQRQPHQEFVVVATAGKETPRAEVAFVGPGRWLAFGQVIVGTTTTAALKLSNTGTRDGHIASIEITGAGADQFAEPYTWPVLKPGGTVDLLFSCTPKPPVWKTLGPRLPLAPRDISKFGRARQDVVATARITVQVRPGETVTLTRQLRASVGIARINVPKELTFPVAAQGTTTSATLTIGNTGNVPLSVSTLSIAAYDPFTVDPKTVFPITVPAQQTRQVRLTYHGLTGGTSQSVQCLVSSNDPTAPMTPIILNGRTTGAELILLDNQEMVDFGRVAVGQASTGLVHLKNIGDALTTIEKVTTEPAAFTVRTPIPVDVPAGATVSIEVAFAPTSVARVGGQMLLTSPSRPEPIWVGFSGEGL